MILCDIAIITFQKLGTSNNHNNGKVVSSCLVYHGPCNLSYDYELLWQLYEYVEIFLYNIYVNLNSVPNKMKFESLKILQNVFRATSLVEVASAFQKSPDATMKLTAQTKLMKRIVVSCYRFIYIYIYIYIILQ